LIYNAQQAGRPRRAKRVLRMTRECRYIENRARDRGNPKSSRETLAVVRSRQTSDAAQRRLNTWIAVSRGRSADLGRECNNAIVRGAELGFDLIEEVIAKFALLRAAFKVT